MLKYGPDLISQIARNYWNLHRAKDILEAIGQNPDLRRIYEGFYHRLPLSLATNPIKSFPRLFLRQSRYRHQTQRPSFYLPELEAKPWWPSDSNSKTLVANSDIIAKEFEDLKSRIKSHPQEYLVSEGNWLTLNLFRDGYKIEENCRLCPQTTEIVESLPLCEQASGCVYFSVMMPGTKVNPHCGPINTRIRYHLTLSHDEQAWMRVDAEKRSWEPHGCFVFDDSFEHEVQHHGHVPRVVLLVDCWHPGLSGLEREWLERLYAEIGGGN
jgi:aspartate beta-hydroxylase